jgi:LysM repeat protein
LQTMPEKTRRAVMIGAVLAAVTIASVAIWAANRAPNQAVDDLDQLLLQEVQGTGTNPSNPTTPQAAQANPATPVEAGADIAAGADPGAPAIAIPETHTVVEGDTLYSISRQYYNDFLYAADIEALNELKEPNDLKPGTQLNLPKWEDLQK